MKKLLFGALATVLFPFIGNAQKKVSLVDVKGVEVAIIIDMKEDNTFTDFYLFQYDDIDFSKILNSKSITLMEAGKDMVRLKCDDEIVFLTIDKEAKNENGPSFYGYGLSKRKGVFSLIENENPQTILDLILINNKAPGKLTCHSGGAGSSECSVTPSNVSVGTTACSVKCNAGYYSCCDDTVGECRCIKEKVKSTSIH